jgi:hypothetical protein
MLSELLLQYRRPELITWVYLSSLLSMGLFFVFHRLWSVRNLDVLLLIALAPGMVMVHEGRKLNDQQSPVALVGDTAVTTTPAFKGQTLTALRADPPNELPSTNAAAPRGDLEQWGFIWLLGVSLLILVRLLLDPTMVRRPLLDPNLSQGGMLFITISLLVFLLANVVTTTPIDQRATGPKLGPGYPLLDLIPTLPTTPDAMQSAPSIERQSPLVAHAMLARVMAIAAQMSVVLGVILIGYRHFNNFKAGVGAAAFYLLVPYTAQMTGRVDHVLPSALLVWAVLLYRRPLFSGILVSLAAGLVYYPLFLLPLWISFYWPRGRARFIGGVVGTLALLTGGLALFGDGSFIDNLQKMYGLVFPRMQPQDFEGVWGLGWSPHWRLPVIVAFMMLCTALIFWPAQKNLGTLLSCSAAVMVAAQFWHGFGGGLYVAWYLPLLLLTVFRPNLEDRVALKVLSDPGMRRRVAQPELGAA